MDNLERLKLRTGETDEAILEDCLETAKNAILSRRYPFKEWSVGECGSYKLEPRYYDLQFRCAMDLYNKIGAEGEIRHDSNGIGRTYESSWISSQLLEEIVPLVGCAR